MEPERTGPGADAYFSEGATKKRPFNQLRRMRARVHERHRGPKTISRFVDVDSKVPGCVYASVELAFQSLENDQQTGKKHPVSVSKNPPLYSSAEQPRQSLMTHIEADEPFT